MKKRSVKIMGHLTSVSLEEPFWDALKSIADERGVSMNALIAKIDRDRSENLSSALRLHVLKTLQEKQ
jgi:predicted DNA-binding ribbon-helix-helix protein